MSHAEGESQRRRQEERREEVSGSKPRNTGQPADSQPRPSLHPVPPTEERPRPASDPKLKAALDNVQRQALERREQVGSKDEEPKAAKPTKKKGGKE
jgi:hypothetical protein